MTTTRARRGWTTRIWPRVAVIFAIIGIAAALNLSRSEAQTALPEISVRPLEQPPKLNDRSDRPGDNKSGTSGGDGKGGFEQLNRELKRKVDETNPVVNTPPLDARSADPKIGVINIPGVQQQYGKNFGVSVYPYRPNQVFTPPLGGRH
jgi:hypothetical protein